MFTFSVYIWLLLKHKIVVYALFVTSMLGGFCLVCCLFPVKVTYICLMGWWWSQQVESECIECVLISDWSIKISLDFKRSQKLSFHTFWMMSMRSCVYLSMISYHKHTHNHKLLFNKTKMYFFIFFLYWWKFKYLRIFMPMILKNYLKNVSSCSLFLNSNLALSLYTSCVCLGAVIVISAQYRYIDCVLLVVYFVGTTPVIQHILISRGCMHGRYQSNFCFLLLF